jgi:hypothetical protein
MAENGQRAKRGSNQHSGSDTVSLAQIGLDAKESERFQQMAAVPKRQLEAALKEARETQQPITSASVRALTRQPDFTPAHLIGARGESE